MELDSGVDNIKIAGDDTELVSQAQKLGLNISGVTEHALHSYVQMLQNDGQHVSSPVIDTRTGSDDVEGHTPEKAQHTESSVEEILDTYENYAKTVLNRSENTVNQHRRYIGRLLRHSEQPPSAIAEADIMTYLESEQPMSDSKKNNILSSLRVFFSEYLDREVADDFEMPTRSLRPTEVPTKDELQIFYTHRQRY